MFELALAWLDRKKPAPTAQPVLVHGDYRTGNYLADETGVTAILDWEGAHLGDPIEDLGWLCVKSWRFGAVDRPAGGFGSRASYRGDKLTAKTWAQMAGTDYVAQALVPPSQRHLGPGDEPLKVDIRAYAYRGQVLLFAARTWQGQTTNFRTPGGGFAPVLTLLEEARPRP